MSEELYYIASPYAPCGNSVSWWCVDGHGYTADLNKAWKVDRARAESIVGMGRGDRAYPADKIDAGSQRHFDSQYLPPAVFAKSSQELILDAYHHWYYDRDVWRRVSFLGVYCAKNVLDLWNYQEIIWELRPGLIVEFGTYAGGTAMYLAWVMDLVHQFGEGSPTRNVLTVDLDHGPLNSDARMYVDCLKASSTSELAWKTIMNRRVLGAPSMFILDSDHSKANVLAELEMLRGLTRAGDCVIVEDTNINGHPVLPNFGPGPWEALEEYERLHPNDYEHDTARETKFGMTFNPRGYLRRK